MMYVFFFFFSIQVFFPENSRFTDTRGRGEAISLSPLYYFHLLQILRHQPGDYCRELTFAHSQQPDSNQEPLVSEHKSLTTKLRTMYGSRDMEQNRQNFLSFWTTFCPFTPPNNLENQDFEKMKKTPVEISSFYTSMSKIMIITTLFLRYGGA